MAFPGKTRANLRIPKWANLYAAQSGYAYNDATYGTRLGLRKETALELKPVSITDSSGRPLPNATDVELKAKLLQTNIRALQTIITLSRAPHSFWAQSEHGDYFSFVQNVGGPLAANGSAELGLSWKMTIDKNSREIESTWHGRLYRAEVAWLYANMAALQASPASGTGGSGYMASQDYDRTKFRESNFADIKIGGISLGYFGDLKIDLESVEHFTDEKERKFCGSMKVKIEATAGQTAAADLIAADDTAELDEDILITTAAGDQFEFLNGSILIAPGLMINDKESQMKLSIEGEIPLSRLTWTDTKMSADFAS